jgi:hypothetical protein
LITVTSLFVASISIGPAAAITSQRPLRAVRATAPRAPDRIARDPTKVRVMAPESEMTNSNVIAALAVRSPRRGVVSPEALPAVFQVGFPGETWRLDEARRTFEEQFVRAALVRTGGHRARAAHELGVTRQGLTKLMARLGILHVG